MSAEPLSESPFLESVMLGRGGGLSSDQIGALLDQFRPYLLAIATRELPPDLGGKLAASDLVQETLLKGHVNLGAFEGRTREQLARWLRAILLRCLANQIRTFDTDKRSVGLEQPLEAWQVASDDSSPSRDLADCEERLRLDAAMHQLSNVHRELILMRHRDDLSFADIGKKLGKSEDAARQQWARAIQKLKSLLRLHA